VKEANFEEVYNLEGGIDAYANEVDSSVGKY
jgi:rhodanese-related sulfurtransferase